MVKKVIKSIQHSNNIKLTDYPKTIVDNFLIVKKG